MELYREKKARNLVTIKALLELKNLLLEEFQSSFFSGYMFWKAMHGSAREKHVDRGLDMRAVTKTLQ